MIHNLDVLNKYKENKLLVSQKHPFLPLIIWNYSSKTQYEGLWDEITLKCRGLVTDFSGNIVARSFDKFFNLEEEESIPSEPFEVYEKLDGSLIIVFYYKDQIVVSSKGSFDSIQALKSIDLLNKYNVESLDKSKTYCFELIAPWNRIVCNYGSEEKLVLLAKFDVFGNEYKTDYYKRYFQIVNKHSFDKIEEIKQSIKNNEEGYVVKFSSGKRIKIKGKEYLRLHKIISNLNINTIYEELINSGNIDSIIENIPDEYHDWVKKTEKELLEKYNNIYNEAKSVFKEFSDRKEAALYFLKQKNPQVLFHFLDKKNPRELIWKLVGKEI